MAPKDFSEWMAVDKGGPTACNNPGKGTDLHDQPFHESFYREKQ